MQEYTLKLEREERSREEQFMDRLRRIDRKSNYWMNEGAGRVDRDKERRMEESLLKEQLKKAMEDQIREERERNEKRARDMAIINENLRISELKRQERLNEAEKKEEDARIRRELEEYQTNVRLRREEETRRKKQYADVLRRQMAERSSSADDADFTQKEEVLSGVLLKNALESDEDTRRRLKETLTYTSSSKP